jgi:membrane-bound serine protease (ClpP class)
MSLFLFTLAMAISSPADARADSPSVLVIDVEDTIDTLTVDHVARGLDKAHSEGSSLVVIRLDTPGGRLDSTRRIVESLLESSVPIAVFVSPAGARAASAGTFIVAAANFAVMAPGTNIGAASPVGAGGADLPNTLSRKVSEGTQAFVRSIAQVRGRNASALEETVSKTAAYSAQEALSLGIIDFLATDFAAMLTQIHGRTAVTAAGSVEVATKGITVNRLDSNVIESIVRILANPNVVLILFVIGGLALLVELSAPGLIGPGTFGVFSVALALVGFLKLPGSWGGLLLLILAMVLFFAETTAPGFSVFGVGGIIALVLGSIFLFGTGGGSSDLPEPSYSVSPLLIGATAAFTAVTWVLFIRFVRSEGGTTSGFQTEEEEELEGAWGVALSDLEPSGRVRVASKEWAASADPGVSIREGDEIRVTGVYGQVLKVERLYQERKH